MAQQSMTRSLRILAFLLAYPDAEWRRHLAPLGEAVRSERAIPPARRPELLRLVDALRAADPLDAEAEYVQLFDRGRSTALHLFEHVHGDSRERGPALIDLGATYASAGLELRPGELPDFLPAVLEFASTQPAREARALLGEIAHIVNRLFMALIERQSPYACVLGALLELAGEKAQPVDIAPEPPLDATWAEPPAFDGCASAGRTRSSAPQPMHFFPSPSASRGVGA